MLVGRQHKVRLVRRQHEEYSYSGPAHPGAEKPQNFCQGRKNGTHRIFTTFAASTGVTHLLGAQRVEHALRARVGGVEAEGDEDIVPCELEAVEA